MEKGLPANLDEQSAESVEFQDLLAGTFHDDLPLAGPQMHLLCQPMRFDQLFKAEPPAFKEGWVLCGLVSSARQLQRALGVAPQFGLMIFLTLAYLIFAWPFIKLFLMNRHERLKRDAYLLFASTLACLSMSSVLLVDFDTYRRANEDLESELRELAGQVAERLDLVRAALTTKLESHDRDFEEDFATCPKDGDDRRACTGLTSEDGDTGYEAGFTSVFWMDGNGDQLHKGTVYDANRPFVNLEHREYFRAVRDDRMWELSPDGTESDRLCARFFLEPILSVTTGERELAVSCSSRQGDAFEAIAIALTAEPASLLEPVVPAGFAFAVTDGEGRVLFHSDPRLGLEENLFDELSQPSRLRSAIRSGAKAHFITSYQTRPHLLYVRPLDRFPWYVVTFYDLEVLRTVNLEALLHTTFVALPYILVLSLALLVLGACAGARHWFWPDKARGRLYASLARRRRAAEPGLLPGGVEPRDGISRALRGRGAGARAPPPRSAVARQVG